MSLASARASQNVISVIQGEWAVSEDPHAVMTTVLGSCIAACIYDPQRQIGGMNHFLLAQASTGRVQDVKYGAYLMELLINNLLKKGAQRHQLRVKLCGGGKMNKFTVGVGEQNIKFAREYLRDEGIPIDWQSLGGDRARRIHFHPVGGRLIEKFVQNDVDVDVAPAKLRRPAAKPDVELF